MKKTAVAIIVIMAMIPVLAQAQIAPDLKNKSYVGNSPVSLFDPSKLTMSQSYSFSYFTGGGHSGNVGLYMNSIEYAIANPLKIRVDLGFLHTPSQLFSGNSSVVRNGVFIPGVSLDWRPSRHFNLRLDYRQQPSAYRWLQGDEYDYNNLREDYR